MDKIKERLILFAKSQGLMMMDFYKKITVAASNFSGDGANSALSTDKIVHILTTYPDINPDWLLLEKGEMLRSDDVKNSYLSSEKENLLKKNIYDKERRIEELIRENEQMRIENEQMKASTGNTGIVVQHDGGGNSYSINADMQQLVTSQQKTIQDLTEQNKTLTQIIVKKI